MSITVEFSSNIDGEANPKVTVPYDKGDYEIYAGHITCVVAARNYGKNYIKKILEPIQTKTIGELTCCGL